MTMTTKKEPYVHGTRPAHEHIDENDQRWLCNSPYCNDVHMNRPEDGGPVPVISGMEPWRGRQ
jgi:hypothetical protein